MSILHCHAVIQMPSALQAQMPDSMRIAMIMQGLQGVFAVQFCRLCLLQLLVTDTTHEQAWTQSSPAYRRAYPQPLAGQHAVSFATEQASNCTSTRIPIRLASSVLRVMLWQSIVRETAD